MGEKKRVYEFLKHLKRSLFKDDDWQNPTEFIHEFLKRVKTPNRTLLTVDTDGLKSSGGHICKETLLNIINTCKSYGVQNFDFAFETRYGLRLYKYIESAIKTIDK